LDIKAITIVHCKVGANQSVKYLDSYNPFWRDTNFNKEMSTSLENTPETELGMGGNSCLNKKKSPLKLFV